MFQKTLAKLVTLARLRGILTFCLNILIRMVPRTSPGFLLGVWGAATGTRCTTIPIRGLATGSSEQSTPAYRTEPFPCRAFRHYIVYGHATSLIMLKVYEVARFFASPKLGRSGEIFSRV